MLTENPEANRRIEKAFMAMGEGNREPRREAPHHADGSSRGWRGVRVSDQQSRDCPRTIQLDLRLVEADQVTTPDLNSIASPMLSMESCSMDSGNPVEYQCAEGNIPAMHVCTSVRVSTSALPAESPCVHWFRA
jgi:hypothetical protein